MRRCQFAASFAPSQDEYSSGILLTLIVGDVTVKGFVDFAPQRSNPPWTYVEAVPGSIIGTFERVLAFVLVFFSVEEAEDDKKLA